MVSIDEMQEMLDEIATELPREFYADLNGGIMLLPETKHHSEGKDLHIMGEYHHDRLGRYIAIYYGSFIRVYGHLPRARLKEQLRKTLKHEFRHHLESLAGDRGLERKDARDLRDYLDRRKQR